MTVVTVKRPAVDVDDMGEASFPASDPPAVWTWDVAPAPPVATDPEPVRAARSPELDGRAGGL